MVLPGTSLNPAVPVPRLTTFLAMAALALAVAGCGSSSDKGLLSSTQASRLESQLEKARRAIDANHCTTARNAAQAGAERASGLSSRVDDKLRRNLVDGFNHLNDRINAECDQPHKTPTPTATATVTATQTAEPTSTPTTTPTPTETPTETASPTPTETVPPDVTPVPTVDNGGAQG